MSEHHKSTLRELELVAALAEGRLEGRERAEAVARIESDPALLEVYAEAMAFLEEEAADETPPERDEANRRPWVLPLAAVLVLTLLGVPLWRAYLTPVRLDVASLAADVAAEPARLGEGWYETGWEVTRGPEANVPGADLAFRLGVRAVDLDVALEAGAVEDAIALTRRLEGLLESVEVSEPQRQAYRQVRALIAHEGVVRKAREYTEVADGLNGESGEISAGSYRLGKWAETGRLAVLAGDATAVREPGYRRAARGLDGSNEERRRLLAGLRAALEADAPVDRLAAAYGALVRAH